MRHFIANITERALNHSELGGRSSATIHDFMHAMSEYNLAWKTLDSFAFEMTADTAPTLSGDKTAASSSSSSSSTAADSSGSLKTKWDQPFPIHVAKYPLDSNSGKALQKYSEDKIYGGASKHDDLPSSVPPFPPAYTYQNIQPRRKRLNTEMENSCVDAGAGGKRGGSAIVHSLIDIESKTDSREG